MIEVEREGSTARVWLARPQQRNAFDAALVGAIQEAFETLARDPALRVVVLGGRGGTFSAGADLEWMRASLELSQEQNLVDARRLETMLEAVDSCPVPVIGRIQGAAMGGGAGLAACCDIVIAEPTARFAFSEVKLGLIPGTIAPFVVGKIGRGHARHLFLTGQVFDAERARAIGLVHELADDLDVAVEATIAAILRAGPEAVRHAKRVVRALPEGDMAAAIAERRASCEGQEGLRAFLERREPRW